jgi:hypothetical protein
VKANLIISSRWLERWKATSASPELQVSDVSRLTHGTCFSVELTEHTRFPLQDFGLTKRLTLLSTEIKVSVGTFTNNCMDISGAHPWLDGLQSYVRE